MAFATPSRAALVFVAGLAAPVASARQSQTDFGKSLADPWPANAAFNNGSFGRSVVLDVEGDGHLDVVVLDANVPMFLACPDRYSGVMRLGTRANDIDVVPLGNPALGADAIVGVSNLGVWTQGFDGALWQFTSPTVIAAGPWVSARFVRAAEIDSLPGLDFIGVASDRITALVLLATPSGYVAGQSFTLAGQAKDVVLVDWDGDGTPEFAFRTLSGLEVFDSDGARLFALGNATSGGALCALRLPGVAKQLLAWITASGPGEQELRIVGDGFATQTTSVGPLGAVGMTAADEDLDLDPDLFVTATSSHHVHVFIDHFSVSKPGAQLFDTAPPTPSERRFWYTDEIDPNTPAPGMKTSPLVADFDHDGDVDIVVPVDRTATGVHRHVETLRGFARDENLQYVSVGQALIWSAPQSTGSDALLMFTATLPSPPGVIAYDPDFVDVIVWRQPTALVDHVTVLGNVESLGKSYRFPLAAGSAQVVVPLSNVSSGYFAEAFRVQIEPVRVAGGATVHFPTHTRAVFGTADTGDALRVEEYWPGVFELLVQLVGELVPESRDDAGFIGKPDVKPVAEGVVPRVTTQTPPPPPH